MNLFFWRKPSPAPEGVRELEGHWWRHMGLDPLVLKGPVKDRQWARDVWRCDKCGAESKVFANPPKVWGSKHGQHFAIECSVRRP